MPSTQVRSVFQHCHQRGRRMVRRSLTRERGCNTYQHSLSFYSSTRRSLIDIAYRSVRYSRFARFSPSRGNASETSCDAYIIDAEGSSCVSPGHPITGAAPVCIRSQISLLTNHLHRRLSLLHSFSLSLCGRRDLHRRCCFHTPCDRGRRSPPLSLPRPTAALSPPDLHRPARPASCAIHTATPTCTTPSCIIAHPG